MALTQTFNEDASGNTQVVFPSAQPVTAASLPLPAGAATAAKQPALGVAGTASADVLTIQGAAGMTALKVDGSGVTQPVTFSASGSAALTSVASSASSVSLLAANAARKGIVLFNDGTQIAYVAYAATATSSAFTIKMFPGSFLEPQTNYSGAISAIWASANGSMRVTELS